MQLQSIISLLTIDKHCLFVSPFSSTLLELGASPNYRDGRGITPLYISITRKCEAKITESLLHDHATLGIQDSQGWNEVHQVKSVAEYLFAFFTLSISL